MKKLKHILVFCLAVVAAAFAFNSCGEEDLEGGGGVQQRYRIQTTYTEINMPSGRSKLTERQVAQLESLASQASFRLEAKSSEDVAIAYYDNQIKSWTPTLQEVLDNTYKQNGAQVQMTIRLLDEKGNMVKETILLPKTEGVEVENGPYRIQTLIIDEGTLSAEHIATLQGFCATNSMDLNPSVMRDGAEKEFDNLVLAAKMLIQEYLNTWKRANGEEGEVQTRLLDATDKVLKTETYSTMSTR